jgi:hypothetical protein
MAHRQFVTWTTEQTPYGSASWAMIDGLLHAQRDRHEGCRSWLAYAAETSAVADVGIVERAGLLRMN